MMDVSQIGKRAWSYAGVLRRAGFTFEVDGSAIMAVHFCG
jgi:hypothetical protein